MANTDNGPANNDKRSSDKMFGNTPPKNEMKTVAKVAAGKVDSGDGNKRT